MRADLPILTDMAQKGETQKTSKKKQRIKKKYKITTNQELQATRKGETQKISKKNQRIKKKYKITTNQELQATRESLKMTIQAKAQRIRRYVRSTKQFSQNQMFANNRKKFFRSLGKEQILVENAPKKETSQTFWRTILENNREYNNSAEWIKREEQKYTDIE